MRIRNGLPSRPTSHRCRGGQGSRSGMKIQASAWSASASSSGLEHIVRRSGPSSGGKDGVDLSDRQGHPLILARSECLLHVRDGSEP